MIFWFGVGAGVGLMLAAQLVVEARTPRPIDFPRNLPERLDVLARWGRVRATRIAAHVAPALPRRTPGATLRWNPPDGTPSDWFVAWAWLTYQPVRLRAWWDERVRRVEDWFDPLAGWDFEEWWAETFYDTRRRARHRVPDMVQRLDEPTWNRWVTQDWPVVDPHDWPTHRRERTTEEWARIMETNKRTWEVRRAHHSGGPRLRRKEYAGI